MKLWQKDFSTHQAVEAFTVGRDREMDLRLAPFDILGSLAHTQMLSEVGLLESVENQELSIALKKLYRETIEGNFVITEGVEDVHSQVEFLLTQQ